MRDAFRQVGSDGRAYRGTPFWSWNDDPDPEELRRQIGEIKRVGLGGHMMHARIGLETPYLDERRMECIRAAVEESAKIGIDAWLSSLAEGRVPANGEAHRQKWIVVQEIAPDYFEPTPHTLAVFVRKKMEKKTGDSWDSLKRVSDPTHARREARHIHDATVLHFSYAMGEDVDLLSAEAVQDFIQENYEAYRPVIGDEFGKRVPGIVTDEAQWQHVPWSHDLPAFYKEHYGEDLLDALPSVFFPVGDYLKARYRFWSAVTRLYVRSFSQQIGEWCQSRHLTFAGHPMSEGSLGSQIRSIGASLPHYEHMGMPGIIAPGRRLADPPSVKQAASVGDQLGVRVLSEMYGGAGWNVSLEELKWIGEAQIALGVNFPCPHRSHYSLSGCQKRDDPPSLHYQQPWWSDYKLLNDRFARLLYALTQGKKVTETLLLHPIGSAWAVHDPHDFSAVDEMSRHFEGISRFLLGIHRDHDYGNEFIMEHYASVSEGKLKIGQAEYSAVILPPLATIQRNTAKLLREFHAAGGKLILIGEGPERLDGEAGPDADAFHQWLSEAATLCERDDPAALESALFALGWPKVQIKDENGDHAESILLHQREAEGKQVLFLANADRENAVRADIALQGLGSVQEWNPDTGDITLVPVRQALGNTAFKLDFQPMQSRLIVLDPDEEPWIGSPGRSSDVGIFYGEQEWDLTLLSPNTLTLDMARYRIEDGEWSEPKYVLHIQEELAKHGGDFQATLEFSFENRMTETPDSLHLVMELPQDHAIQINGVAIENADEGWWTDISFRKIPIAGKLLPGDNTIALTRRFISDPKTSPLISERTVHESGANRCKHTTEIEAIYLLGFFGVEAVGKPEKLARNATRLHGPFALTDAPAQVTTGDLSVQGLPFFCGTVALEQEIWIPERPGDDVRSILELETLNASVVKVIVNEEEIGKLAWRPYRLDVTDFVPEGENIRLRLELTGSCRNLLGPHHHIDGELHSVGPDSFIGRKGRMDRPDAPDSTWHDGYSFVNFGVEGDVLVLFEAPNNQAPDPNLVRRQCG